LVGVAAVILCCNSASWGVLWTAHYTCQHCPSIRYRSLWTVSEDITCWRFPNTREHLYPRALWTQVWLLSARRGWEIVHRLLLSALKGFGNQSYRPWQSVLCMHTIVQAVSSLRVVSDGTLAGLFSAVWWLSKIRFLGRYPPFEALMWAVNRGTFGCQSP